MRTVNPLVELQKFGQSFWYDNMRRSLITTGELARLVKEDGLRGITSNPTIFEKAISGSADYDEAMSRLVDEGKSSAEILDELMVEDIGNAADVLRPVYDASDGSDGFVCLEVSPLLAHKTEETIGEAVRLHGKLGRPNVMIKIPSTPAGIPAIEEVISRGINVNVTLMFAPQTYEQVAEAYMRGLERRVAAGLPVNRMASVASLFVSRVDTAVDKILEKSGAPAELLGKAAVANSRLLYRRFQEIFHGLRFGNLGRAGARPQRLLWASTSTKNPRYSDVMYVEALIGPETVDTLPEATIQAFRDHGRVAPTLAEGQDEAQNTMKRLADAGVDYARVMQQLQDDGVKLFAESFEKLLAGLAAKREAVLAAKSRLFLGCYTGAFQESLGRAQSRNYVPRLWARDASLWKDDRETQEKIRNRLGWLDSVEQMRGCTGQIRAFADEVRGEGFTHALLLGMGGSSLCAEVCRNTYGVAPGYLDVRVMDTTSPEAIADAEKNLLLNRTLVVVATKSGTTIESLCLFRYYWEKIGRGRNFAAITDPGTPLEALAREKQFRRTFLNAADIGGRYSALSHFGLAPAALAGADIDKLLERAREMAGECSAAHPGADNPALELGLALAALAAQGRDKITFLPAPEIADFGHWVEQLIAESTGKEGRGLVPVVDEKAGPPEVYGADRVFVHMFLQGRADGLSEAVEALERAGHPVIRLALRDTYDLGGEFFRWEAATALAGALIGINPFDEPNVTESKQNTARLLRVFRDMARLPNEQPAESADLPGLLSRARPGDYIALMAYLPATEENARRLAELRHRLRDRCRLATTLGYGPRFLHSTGQLHKGGPAKGIFIQITAEHVQDLAIPGEHFSFGILQDAQAQGDLEALRKRERPVMRFHNLNTLERG